jgi:hypothetical protein
MLCLLDLIHGSDISGSRVRFVDPPVLTAFPAFVFLSVGRGFVHHRHVGHSVFQFYCDAGASAWFSFLPQQIPRAGCHPGSGFFGWFSRLGAALRFASSFGSCSVLVRRSIWLSTGFPAWVSTARVVLPPALGSSSQLGFPFKCLIFSASPGILRFAVCRFVLPLGTVQRKNPSAFLLSCLISGVSGFLSAAVSVSVISCN